MSDNEYSYEPWELTAYLLDELEPGDRQRLNSIIQSDPQVAQQVRDLGATIQQVKSALGNQRLSAGEQTALTRLAETGPAGFNQAAQNSSQNLLPASSQRPRLVGRLARRWENWASLAGLMLIALLLVQRNQPTTQPLAGQSASTPVPSTSAAGDASVALPEPIGAPSDRVSELAKVGQATVHEALSQTAPIDGLHSGGQASEAQLPGPQSSASGSPPPSAPLVASTPLASAPSAPASQMGMGGMMGGALDAGMGGGQLGQGMMGGAIIGGGYGGGMGGSMGGSMGGMGYVEYGLGGEGGAYYYDSAPRPREYGLGPPAADPFQAAPASGDRFAQLTDNPFQAVQQQPLSTFSIDVDTASYSKVRQYLLEYNQLPPPAAVRLEEFINSFDYNYAGPEDERPFAAALAVSDCPWKAEHKLVRIALQARQIEMNQRPRANLVFLLDVSGSMNQPNKLPLVKESIRLLTYQLGENDSVAIVVYAGAAGCVLAPTPGNQQDRILAAIDRLAAGGSTNGGQGIELAYALARDNLVPGGINRVILCTDGDFNVGTTGTEQLVDLVQRQAQGSIFLTVLGFGMGNTNDAMMEQIADQGNGLYGFIDSRNEAQRQMVKQLAGNLITVAKDVKVQVEFNPGKVRAYRLLGYENRLLAAEDFNNDRKDAGDIGAGHRVTALYELAMVGTPERTPDIEPLRYQTSAASLPDPAPVPKVATDQALGEVSHELLAVKLRFKQPEATESQLLVYPLEDRAVPFTAADNDFRWAAAMAEFGMLLRRSPHRGSSNWAQLKERALQAAGTLSSPQRAEALDMIRQASQLMPDGSGR